MDILTLPKDRFEVDYGSMNSGGGICRVYPAIDQETGGKVAIRFYYRHLQVTTKEDLLRQESALERAAPGSAFLSHNTNAPEGTAMNLSDLNANGVPNISTLVGVTSLYDPNPDSMVVNFIEGTQLNKVGGWDAPDTLTLVIKGLCETLKGVYGAGYSIGDIKPSDIILGDQKMTFVDTDDAKASSPEYLPENLKKSLSNLTSSFVKGNSYESSLNVPMLGIILKGLSNRPKSVVKQFENLLQSVDSNLAEIIRKLDQGHYQSIRDLDEFESDLVRYINGPHYKSTPKEEMPRNDVSTEDPIRAIDERFLASLPPTERTLREMYSQFHPSTVMSWFGEGNKQYLESDSEARNLARGELVKSGIPGKIMAKSPTGKTPDEAVILEVLKSTLIHTTSPRDLGMYRAALEELVGF